MGVHAELLVRGRPVVLTDPSGGTFNAAGDFDRLLPVSGTSFPILARVDPYGTVVVLGGDKAALVTEADLLLEQARTGPERRGLLRLRALAVAGQAEAGGVLQFTGD
jgi:hypothetical protein